MVWHTLRQQSQKPADRANLCLADFVAPLDAGVPDWVGAFAVTAGLGCDERVAAFEAEHDDYSAIMLKALADRLAEAFAERLHQRVRREFWGYAPDEHLDNDSLIAEKYRGIRPAPGYPACPDHTAKARVSGNCVAWLSVMSTDTSSVSANRSAQANAVAPGPITSTLPRDS